MYIYFSHFVFIVFIQVHVTKFIVIFRLISGIQKGYRHKRPFFEAPFPFYQSQTINNRLSHRVIKILFQYK